MTYTLPEIGFAYSFGSASISPAKENKELRDSIEKLQYLDVRMEKKRKQIK
jgi:hypothetical protein